MKSILVVSFSSLFHDSRVKRQLQFLTHRYDVTLAAYNSPDGLTDNFIQIAKPRLTNIRKIKLAISLLFRVHSISYKLLFGENELTRRLQGKVFDLVIANDIETLPISFKVASLKGVVLDAHEYSPRQFEDKFIWRLLFQPLNNHICKKYIARTVAMTTIGKGIAAEYKRNFKCDPIVINNATWKNDINISPVGEQIKIIHHGGATTSRHLENMIEMMQYLDNRFTLNLMLVVPELASAKTRNYISKLKSIASEDKRITFVAAVKSDEVISKINQYDLGIIIVPSVNFNYANGLPNKLFEFIQARLAVCVGPIPEIAEIIRQYDLGIVFETFDPKEVAYQLSSLTKKRLNELKQNSARAAKELTAESNSLIFNKLIEDVLMNANPQRYDTNR